MENTDVMQVEATTPIDSVADDVGTTPTDTTAANEAGEQTEVTTPETVPTEGEAPTADEPPNEVATSEPFTVRFKHRDVELTREDAVNFAQKGMLYDEMAPTIDTLRRMAAGAGKTVAELVGSIAQANERAMKARFLQEAHGDESVAERLMQLEQSRLQSAYDSSLAAEKAAEETAQKTLTDRLATEFVELQAEFPELKEFKDIPASVVNEAINKGRNLCDVYLRHWRQEQKRIAANNASRQTATAASVGSRADGGVTVSEDPATTSVRNAIRSVFE